LGHGQASRFVSGLDIRVRRRDDPARTGTRMRPHQ
jgi:hypothetical protein